MKEHKAMETSELNKRIEEIRRSPKKVKEEFPEEYEYINSLPAISGRWIEKVYMFVNDMKEPHICNNPNCNNYTRFIDYPSGYQPYCSSKCSNSDEEVKRKKEKTTIEHYGMPYVFGLTTELREITLDGNLLKSIKDEDERILREDNMRANHPLVYSAIRNMYKGIDDWQEVLYLYINELEGPPICLNEECEKRVEFKNGEYQKYCSRACALEDNKEMIKEKREATLLEKYGSKSPFGSKEVREQIRKTCLEKYGVENPAQLEEIQNKMKQTNLERYGVENVFSSKEFQNKIKQICLETYGTEYASQNLEVQNKMKQTNLERYGVENVFSSKEFQNKIKQICLETYGTEHAAQNLEVQNKMKQTNLERYGVEYPQQSEEIRAKSMKTNLEHWGTEWYTQSDDFKEKTRNTNMSRYGVEYPMQNPKIKEKSKQAVLKNYGASNPTKSEEIRERIKHTNLERWGTEWSTQSDNFKEKSKQTILEKYGVDNVSKNEEIQKKKEETCMENHKVPYGVFTEKAKEALKELNINQSSEFEIRYLDYIEEFIKPYGWTLKRNYKKILGGKKELDGYIPEINKAFEFNGIYWHSLKIAGNERKKYQHTQKAIQCAEKGVKLLYVWENISFKLGCELIRDFIFDKPLDKYKKIIYPDLTESQRPCDFGISKEDIPNIKEHIYSHRNNNCYDSGYVDD